MKTALGRPSAVFIDKNDVIYVADSQTEDKDGCTPDPGCRRGIRIGSAKDGSLKFFIPDPNQEPNYRGSSAAEGVAVDAQGVVYGAEVGQRDLKKYVRAN